MATDSAAGPPCGCTPDDDPWIHAARHGDTPMTSAAISEATYRTAITLIDEGTESLARRYKDTGRGAWHANLEPREHADLALRLARALTGEEAEGA